MGLTASGWSKKIEKHFENIKEKLWLIGKRLYFLIFIENLPVFSKNQFFLGFINFKNTFSFRSLDICNHFRDSASGLKTSCHNLVKPLPAHCISLWSHLWESIELANFRDRNATDFSSWSINTSNWKICCIARLSCAWMISKK